MDPARNAEPKQAEPARGSNAAAEPRAQGGAYRRTSGPRVVPPFPSRADLHAHSRRSDGVLEPRTLVDAAAAVGVRLLALADHDTLAGVRELRAEAADPLTAKALPIPLELIPAVEINSIATGIDCLWEGELHILGLGVDPDDDEFEATLERQRRARAERIRSMVKRLRELGLAIDEESPALRVQPGGSAGRPQVARALVEAGYAQSVDDAMKRLIARGKPAYVPRQGIGPVEAIRAINASGGIAALAHFSDAPTRRDLVRELVDAGLRGLEVYYRAFDVDTVEGMRAFADEMRLLPSGGSDYHGDGETYAAAHAEIFVPDEAALGILGALGRPTERFERAADR